MSFRPARFLSELRGFERAAVIAVACVVGLTWAWLAPFTNRLLAGELDEHLYRVWARERADGLDVASLRRLRDDMVVILIDEASLEELELTWPLPRDLYGEIVRRLSAAGARTIGLDVAFLDPGPDPARDADLARVLARSEVILPGPLVPEGDRFVQLLPDEGLTAGWTPSDFEQRLGFVTEFSVRDEAGGEALPEVRYAALRMDRRVTDMLGRPSGEQQRYYSWDVQVIAHYKGVSPESVLAGLPLEQTRAVVGDLECTFVVGRPSFLPVGLDTRTRLSGLEANSEGIRFVEAEVELDPQKRSGNLLNVYRLSELLQVPDAQLPGYFKEGPFLALVGVSLTGIDLKRSPLGPMSGVEIHANILSSLLLNNFQREAPAWLERSLVFLPALLVGVLAAVLELRLVAGVTVLLLAGVFFGARTAYLGPGFDAPNLLLPVALPVASTVTAALVVLGYAHQAARRRLERVLRVFREVCPLHDMELLQKEQGLELGGQERELTILFSDLRGYTSFAEKLDSVTVLDTLNEYFGAVGHIFERYGGCVFDYQGDAQMVVFGLLPQSRENHAAAAALAGAAMVAKLEEMRTRWLAAGKNIPQTGVGICSGPVSFGVLGTTQHKQYVAIGDPTNTASRIQGRSEELGYSVLIAESTRALAGETIIATPLKKIQLKGKGQPLQVYGLEIAAMARQGSLEY